MKDCYYIEIKLDENKVDIQQYKCEVSVIDNDYEILSIKKEYKGKIINESISKESINSIFQDNIIYDSCKYNYISFYIDNMEHCFEHCFNNLLKMISLAIFTLISNNLFIFLVFISK